MGQKQKAQDGGRRGSSSTPAGSRSKTSFIRIFSSGGVVFKKEEESILWFVSKSTPSELFPNPVWRLPKGWIDDAGKGIPGPMASGKVRADEKSLRETAIREVKEEGGIQAKIIKKITSIKYSFKFPEKGNILKFVTYYLMEWESDLPEGFDDETSEVAWLPYEEAHKTLSFNREKEILEKAKDLFEQGV